MPKLSQIPRFATTSPASVAAITTTSGITPLSIAERHH
jgi:hypothetical protein